MIGKWMQSAVLALVAGSAMSLSAAPQGGLEVRVSAPQQVFAGDVDVPVDVSISNVTRHPIHVLRWQLPADDDEGALFRVTHEDGTRARYTGAIVKRAKPDASDFVKIEAGATLRYTVELTASYDLSRNGRYSVEYVGRDAHGATAALASTQASYVWLDGRSAKAAPAAAPAPLAKSLAFTSCRATQQTQIATAVTNATAYAGNASAYLAANTQGARYTTWFGTYNSGRYNTVASHFSAIASAFNNADIVIDCSCRKKSTYAYVYANQPYKIYVCGAFWSAPATGTDSKAGTLVHEMSHFTVVAGTDDNAYGQSAAKALAISNPAAAVDNADSHEYFAENTPAQN
jgi:peptidyl-Lys metalloendopeptidase